MPSSTIEDYAKQLYFLQQRQEAGTLVSMGKLAAAMDVVPGTATTMVKTLATAGLAEYVPRSGVKLSPNGESLALRVLRRHRLIESFLVNTLHLDWSEVHEEAEALEHVVSDRVLERIDALLGHPTADPHGAPIPDAQGVLPARNSQPLPLLPGDTPLQLTRVADSDNHFLQFLADHQLKPGVPVRITGNDETAGTITLQLADEASEVTLSRQAAMRIQAQRL